jgi:hypothetical protein
MGRPPSALPLRAKVDTYLDDDDLSLLHQIMEDESRNRSDTLRYCIRAEAKRRNFTPKKATTHGRPRAKASQ